MAWLLVPGWLSAAPAYEKNALESRFARVTLILPGFPEGTAIKPGRTWDSSESFYFKIEVRGSPIYGTINIQKPLTPKQLADERQEETRRPYVDRVVRTLNWHGQSIPIRLNGDQGGYSTSAQLKIGSHLNLSIYLFQDDEHGDANPLGYPLFLEQILRSMEATAK